MQIDGTMLGKPTGTALSIRIPSISISIRMRDGLSFHFSLSVSVEGKHIKRWNKVLFAIYPIGK